MAIFSACSTDENPDPHSSQIVSFTKELNIGASSKLTLREKKDSGFLISGFSAGYGSINNYKAMLTNTCLMRDILWIKYYTVGGYDYTIGGCAVETPDSGILLSGLSGKVDQTDQSFLFLAVIDKSGTWTYHTIYSAK